MDDFEVESEATMRSEAEHRPIKAELNLLKGFGPTLTFVRVLLRRSIQESY